MTTDLNDLWRFDLRRGKSSDPREGACLLDAVSWLEYGTLGDHPPCVCPVIAAFGRRINDAMSDAGRQRLKVFLPRLVGTVDPSAEQARAEYLAWVAIRVFAPMTPRDEDAMVATLDGVLKIGRQAESIEPSIFATAQQTFEAARCTPEKEL